VADYLHRQRLQVPTSRGKTVLGTPQDESVYVPIRGRPRGRRCQRCGRPILSGGLCHECGGPGELTALVHAGTNLYLRICVACALVFAGFVVLFGVIVLVLYFVLGVPPEFRQ
jgi:hypothetical protein